MNTYFRTTRKGQLVFEQGCRDELSECNYGINGWQNERNEWGSGRKRLVFIYV